MIFYEFNMENTNITIKKGKFSLYLKEISKDLRFEKIGDNFINQLINNEAYKTKFEILFEINKYLLNSKNQKIHLSQED